MVNTSVLTDLNKPQHHEIVAMLDGLRNRSNVFIYQVVAANRDAPSTRPKQDRAELRAAMSRFLFSEEKLPHSFLADAFGGITFSKAQEAELDRLMQDAINVCARMQQAVPPGKLVVAARGEPYDSERHERVGGPEDGPVLLMTFPGYQVNGKVDMKANVVLAA